MYLMSHSLKPEPRASSAFAIKHAFSKYMNE